VIQAGATLTRSQKPDGSSPAAGAPRPAEVRKGDPAASVCATVNGEAILDEEVRALCGHALMMARSSAEQAEIFSQALQQLVDRELILQEALRNLSQGPGGAKRVEKVKEEISKEFEHSMMRRLMKDNHLSSEAELRELFREHGVSFELQRRQWERQLLAYQYLQSRISPYQARIGHADLIEYYDKHPEEFQVTDGIEWQDLFVDASEHPSRQAARAFAEVLATRARRGEDFAALGRQYDRGDSRLREFKGVGRRSGEVRPPEAEAVLFTLKDGDAAVVEMRGGFHVVRLVHRDYAHRQPFDEKVQKQIREKLREEVFQRESKRIVRQLRRNAVIEICAGK
jgi:peptidyl-prolyl cis-trans isomerase SurA